MSAAVIAGPTAQVAARPQSVLRQLALKEIGRYLRHPLFLFGFVLCWFTSLANVDKQMSVLESPISPAAGIGLLGLVVTNGLVRSSDRIAGAAGEAPTSMRTRTLAVIASTLVPLTVGLLWFAWAVWEFHRQPPGRDGAPFGGVGNGWAYALLFALGTISCVGGPLLGIVLARWVNVRGAAPVFAVLLVLAVIIMQGLFVSLRSVRLFMPWTQFAGPYGIPGDANRVLILRGSTGWYAVYLALLCGLGAVVSLIPGDGPRRSLRLAAGVVAILAVVACVLASTTGVTHTMINPVHSFNP
jgi:hypothetical protein